jgi:hypothetical protein
MIGSCAFPPKRDLYTFIAIASEAEGYGCPVPQRSIVNRALVYLSYHKSSESEHIITLLFLKRNKQLLEHYLGQKDFIAIKNEREHIFRTMNGKDCTRVFQTIYWHPVPAKVGFTSPLASNSPCDLFDKMVL